MRCVRNICKILKINTLEKTYTIEERNSILTIRLNPQKPAAIVIGFSAVIAITVFFALCLFAILTSTKVAFDNFGAILALIFMLLFAGLCVFAARAFIRRLTQEEELTIDHADLTLTDKYLLGVKKRKFQLVHVKEIFFAGGENFTPHPLDGNYADIGFRGREALVQYAIADGNIMLLYGKRQIRFGRNVPSWDAEEIVAAIEKYTGQKFWRETLPEIDESYLNEEEQF